MLLSAQVTQTNITVRAEDHGGNRFCKLGRVIIVNYKYTYYIKGNKVRRFLLILFICFLGANAYAGSYSGAILQRVAVTNSGTVILWAKSGWGSADDNSCSTGTGVIAFDSKTDAGKSMLSLAISAYMAGEK